MKQTTMQLHKVSTNGVDTWCTVPAYLVPSTTTWYVVKGKDIEAAWNGNPGWKTENCFALYHDGLVAVSSFMRLRDALAAGLRSGQVWDLPGLPEKTSPEYNSLVKIVCTAPGQWWNT